MSSGPRGPQLFIRLKCIKRSYDARQGFIFQFNANAIHSQKLGIQSCQRSVIIGVRPKLQLRWRSTHTAQPCYDQCRNTNALQSRTSETAHSASWDVIVCLGTSATVRTLHGARMDG